MTYGLVAADVDGDNVLEYIFGTTEGHLIVVKPSRREPIHRHVLTATISLVLHSAAADRLVLVTLEGQCEVTETFSAALTTQPVVSDAANPKQSSRQFTVAANCTCGDMHSDQLFLGSSDRRVYVYSIRTGLLLRTTFLHSQIFSLRHFVLGDRSLLIIATTTHLVLQEGDVRGPPGCWTTMELDGMDAAEQQSPTRGVLCSAAAAPSGERHFSSCSMFVQSSLPLWSWTLQRDASDQTDEMLECGGGASYERSPALAKKMMRPTASPAVASPGWSKQPSVRLPVGVDCCVRGPCATIVAASEDGFCWMFTLWLRGLAVLADSDGQMLEPSTPSLKNPLMIRQTWRRPLFLFRGLLPLVCLGQLTDLADVGAFLLAPDGTLVVVDSGRQAVVSKVRHDVSAYCLADSRAGCAVLLCLADDELVEFTVPCDEIGGVSLFTRAPEATAAPQHRRLATASKSLSPSLRNGGETLGHVDDDGDDDSAENERLLMDVGRRLFGPTLGDALIRRKIIALCHDGYTPAEWQELRQLANMDSTVADNMDS
jgi:hypothetical protein